MGSVQVSTDVSSTPSAEQISAYVDLAIALVLDSWPALKLAVQNSWGGPDSAGKREWLAGVLSDTFVQRPETDEEDVEDILTQIMADEFDVQLEDESEIEVAADICRYRKHCLRGDFTAVEELRRRWASRAGERPVVAQDVTNSVAHEESGDELEYDHGEGVALTEDVEMEDAPQLVPVREKPKPEVDDDGFTKVVGKKKR